MIKFSGPEFCPFLGQVRCEIWVKMSFWLDPPAFTWGITLSTEASTQCKAEIPSSTPSKNSGSKTS